jgi:secondary thiamine-phosphate synthase enzyme
VTVRTADFEVETRGDCDILDVTGALTEAVRDTGIRDGIVCAFVAGSTAALSHVEYEPGLLRDIPEVLDKIAPPGDYHHHETWDDGNGHSHVRSTLMGPSIAIPVREGALPLGTWQQVILLDFDNRPRRRKVLVQVVGE